MTRNSSAQSIQRIQGTDGIRGKVKLVTELEKEESLLSPLSCFLETGILTEDFFELYTYTYCHKLLHHQLASPESSVVIGWDSRDRTGVFNEAAIRGVRKAGLKAIVVGILPTPAIALYQIYKQAVCSFVLTASHNPSDQNGIKIFLGSNALKLFPEDDVRFTQALFQQDFEALQQKTVLAEIQHDEKEALQHFIRFSINSFNLWKKAAVFEKLVLIVDAAYGANVPVIQELAHQLSCKALILENCDFSQEINQDSGVANLEGIACIHPEDLESRSGKFRNYSALHRMFQEAHARSDALKSGAEILLAWIFDGDGDRCYLLVYDPFEGKILVCAGDALAWWQGKYLQQQQHASKQAPLFVCTVESDLELSRAAQSAGFESVQTAVGDKWILWQSFLQHWKARKSFYSTYLPNEAIYAAIEALDSAIKNMQESSRFDTLKLTLLFQNAEETVCAKLGKQKFQKAWNHYLEFEQPIHFAIGSEPSGHAISLGHCKDDSGTLHPVFIGNGIKSAFNSCVVLEPLMSEGIRDFYSHLKAPFPVGFQQSKAVYYVNKSLIAPKHEFRKQLQEFMTKKLQEFCPESSMELICRAEDPEMLFFVLNESELPVATIFVRNSGTEDKLSIYVRSMLQKKAVLQSVFDSIYCFLLLHVKNTQSVFAQAEARLIQQLAEVALPESHLESGVTAQEQHRLLHEMGDRQGLIRFQDHKWHVTDLGKSLFHA